jgi:hypothetical protein
MGEQGEPSAATVLSNRRAHKSRSVAVAILQHRRCGHGVAQHIHRRRQPRIFDHCINAVFPSHSYLVRPGWAVRQPRAMRCIVGGAMNEIGPDVAEASGEVHGAALRLGRRASLQPIHSSANTVVSQRYEDVIESAHGAALYRAIGPELPAARSITSRY